MKKKGFTIIEVIIVIAIMGVILVLALPQIGRIRENNKDTKYEAYYESIKNAAKLYVDSRSRDLFGYNDSGCIVLSYSTLKEANLTKDFSDPNITCSDDTETYVQVRKVKDNYQYNTSMICKNKDDSTIVYEHPIDNEFSCEISKDISGPSVVVSPTKSGWTKSEDLSITITVKDPSGLNKNIGITYYWTDTSGKVVSKKYNYNYHNKKGKQVVIHNIPVSRIPEGSGQFQLVVGPWKSNSSYGLQDMLGNNTLLSTTTGIYKLDNDPPICVSNGGSDTFVYNPVTIVGTCSDKHSGCVKKTVTKTFTVDYMNKNVSPGTVYDKVGHSTVCPVQKVRIDTVPKKPTISNPTKEKWVNYNFSLQVKTASPKDLIGYWQYSYDKKSWVTYSNSATNDFTTTAFSKERNQNVYIRVCSKYGSCSDPASTKIRIDKTPPVIEITRVNSNDQLRTSTCIGAKTGTGSAHCHLYIRRSANWAYSTDRKYTDGSGSGINYNRDEYYWDAPGGVGGNQCPFWFIPKVEYNGDYTKCGGTSWKACIRAKMCPNLHEVIQKERIWDNAGNVSGELMIHILLDNYPCTR